MYRIAKVSDGTELGITDSVRYIKIGKNGSFASAERKNATGVALDGVAYNLLGHSDIEGADVVTVSEVDGGKLIAECKAAIEELKTQLAGMIGQEFSQV